MNEFNVSIIRLITRMGSRGVRWEATSIGYDCNCRRPEYGPNYDAICLFCNGLVHLNYCKRVVNTCTFQDVRSVFRYYHEACANE